MVLRCFARRHLVQPRQQHLTAVPRIAQKGYASALNHKSSFATTSRSKRRDDGTGVRVAGERQEVGASFQSSEYFSARLHEWWPKKTGSGYGKADKLSHDDVLADRMERGGRIDQLPQPVHPAIRELLLEVQEKGKTRTYASADDVWRLYRSVRAKQQVSLGTPSMSAEATTSTIEDHASLYVPPFLYKLILRRIAPSISTEDGLPRRPRIREVRLYLSRVVSVFRQMRAIDPNNLPSSADYNRVVKIVARTGDVNALAALWTSMTGDGSRLYALESENGNDDLTVDFLSVSSGTARPTAETYFQLLRGVMLHLNDQIRVMYHRAIREGAIPGYAERNRRQKAWAEDESLYEDLYASSGRTGRQTRQAMALATKRAAGLLDDMRSRNVQFRKATYDVVLRIMRLCGNLTAFKQLINIAFGVDLDHPDSIPLPTADTRDKPSQSRVIDVHTFNTIVMTLGEQSTVSKMVSVYETLRRPLPRSVKEEAQSENLFATDFRGLFKKDDEGSLSSQEGKEKGETSLSIKPNTKTIETLIQFACNPPTAERLAMTQCYRSPSEIMGEAKEHAARHRGAYVHLAPYFLREALNDQEEKILHNAFLLRHSLNAESIDKVVETLTDENFDKSLGLVWSLDAKYASEYYNRLLYLGGTLSGESVLQNSQIRKSRRLNDDVLALQSEAQRAATVAQFEAKEQEITDLFEATRTFVEANTTTIEPLPFAHRKNFLCPKFDTPQIGCTASMFEPLLKHARRRSDIEAIERVGQWMRTAMAMYVVDLRVVSSATTFWLARARSLEKSSTNSNVYRKKMVRTTMKSVMSHAAHVQSQLRTLTDLYVSHVRGRIHHLIALEQARVERQAEAARELAASAALEQELKEQADRHRAERKAEAERLRNVRDQDTEEQLLTSS